ncbi:MAG: TIR domain-containing protein, partial [Blastocatellia bacterium]
MDKPTVFISYSHKDEIWKDRLLPQLKSLQQLDRIVVWDDRQIDAGDQWYPEIKEAMEKAQVAICLISPNYLASDFCVKEEVPFLLQRCEKEGVILIPILIKPCLWELHEWISATQMLPRDGKAVSPDFKDEEDVVFVEVARTIVRKLANRGEKTPAPPPRWSPPEKLDITRLPVTGSDLFGRQKELKLLDEAWESAETNVISFVAWGGVGKSTLVNKWIERMAAENYRGARRVFAWSFYSQGTSERATSADLFINAAL